MLKIKKLTNVFFYSFLLCVFLGALPVFAKGGVFIHGTRVIYPSDSRQVSLSLENSSAEDSFLVQSWLEDASGNRSKDIIATPPLFLSKPKSQNTLRIMELRSDLKKDRESLYYLTVKAIPSVKEGSSQQNFLRVAAATKIKVFFRPNGLSIKVTDAPSMLSFENEKNKLKIKNPTPYYLTLTDIHIGNKLIDDVMVSPESTTYTKAEVRGNQATITYHTINDYGAVTKELKKEVK